MTISLTPDQIVREVVRGERPWIDLRRVGMRMQVVCNEYGWYTWTDEIADEPDVTVALADVAVGLLKTWGDLEERRAWAFVLKAGTFWTFPEEADEAAKDALIDALSDVSFGDEPLQAQGNWPARLYNETIASRSLSPCPVPA